MPDGRIPVAIAGNNLLRVVRDPVMLFTTLVLPFLIIAVVGVALADNGSRLQTGIYSRDGGALSRYLVAGLRSSAALHATSYADEASLDRAVRRGEVSAAVIIPATYTESLRSGAVPIVRFITTPNQTRSASIRTVVQSVIDGQAGLLQAARFSAQKTGRSVRAELARAPKLSRALVAPTVNEQSVGTRPADALGFQYTAPANLVLFVVITSLTSATTLIESRTRGITRRMFAMPVSRATVLFGELIGRVAIAILQAAVIVLVSAIGFGVSWGDPLAVSLMTLAVCAFGAALGMLVGFAARTVSQAVAFGPPLGIVLGMLGGCMWPLTIVGPVVRAIGHATPQAWTKDAFLDLSNRGAGPVAILPRLGIVLAFAAIALLAAGAVVRRREYR